MAAGGANGGRLIRPTVEEEEKTLHEHTASSRQSDQRELVKSLKVN